MIKNIITGLAILFILSSCTLSQTENKTDISASDSGAGAQENTGVLDPQEDILSGAQENTGVLDPQEEIISGEHEQYLPIFTKGEETKTVHIVHKERTETSIVFTNTDATALEVQVKFPKDETKANLRLAQIMAPDGTGDGPFGEHVAYKLTQTGAYTLILNENTMAGDPWSGKADIVLTLSKKSLKDTVEIFP